jgi:hypothetical protein
MRVLVTGGRDYEDWIVLRSTLIAFKADRGIDLVIHGGCTSGADRMAADWCAQRGIPCARVDAHWKTLGRKAGPMRNGWMVKLLAPDVVLAFPGGVGTANCVQQAEDAGIEIVRVSSPALPVPSPVQPEI